MKLEQLLGEYNDIYFEKSYTKRGGDFIPKPFSKIKFN